LREGSEAAMTDKSFWFETALLPGGWAKGVRMTVSHGRITALGAAPRQPEDEAHAIAVPGLSNVHSHAFQRGMAGLAERAGPDGDDFWSWREVMYRFLARMDPDAIEAITALAFSEMLEGGFTRVGEFHYLHNAPDGSTYADPAELAARIVAAAEATGIGLTLLPVFYAHGDFGGAPPKGGQRRFLTSVDGFARLHEASAALLTGDANIGVAPHSLRAVTADELAAILPLAGAGPVHIHAAEQVKEVAASIAHSGARPVEWLLANAPVDARWCFIHATHLTEAETHGLAASGVVAGLCPVTEANLGDGIFPARRYLGAGGAFGVGTDSNIRIDAAAELAQLEYSQRLRDLGRNLLAGDDAPSTGNRLFRAALAGGHQALAQPKALSIGAPADFVTLDPNHPSLIARVGDDLLDGWIFAAGHAAIEGVWRRGVRMVTAGRHHARDAIRARYARTLAALLA
jgi:formiminoglutamate deiminase